MQLPLYNNNKKEREEFFANYDEDADDAADVKEEECLW